MCPQVGAGRGAGTRTPSRGFGDRWFTINRHPYEKFYYVRTTKNRT